MKLSIVIPCYNEVATIQEIIKRVMSTELLLEKEVIIVDDCSTDGTRDVLKSLQKEYKNIELYFHEKNQGKGAALNTGFRNITGDLVIIQDADLEYDPNEYPKLIKPIIEDKADVVFGSRFIGSEPHRVLYFWHSMGNKLLTLISNAFTNLNLTDEAACYKVFRKEIIKQFKIEEKRFGIDPEVVAKVAKLAKKKNYRIFEVGISYFGRTYSEGKKINWKDGVSAIRCIIKYNLFRRKP